MASEEDPSHTIKFFRNRKRSFSNSRSKHFVGKSSADFFREMFSPLTVEVMVQSKSKGALETVETVQLEDINVWNDLIKLLYRMETTSEKVHDFDNHHLNVVNASEADTTGASPIICDDYDTASRNDCDVLESNHNHFQQNIKRFPYSSCPGKLAYKYYNRYNDVEKFFVKYASSLQSFSESSTSLGDAAAAGSNTKRNIDDYEYSSKDILSVFVHGAKIPHYLREDGTQIIAISTKKYIRILGREGLELFKPVLISDLVQYACPRY